MGTLFLLAAALAAAPLPSAWKHWRYSRPIEVPSTDSVRLAGLVLPVEVEPVPGDRAGLAYRSRVRVAVDGRGALGFRRHRSHRR